MNIELPIGDAKAATGDYIGDDGLLYCGKCKTAKQTKITMPDGKVITVGCLCKCENERIEREKAEDERRERELQIDRYRSVGFPDKELRRCKFSADDGANAGATKAAKNFVEHFTEFREAGKGIMFYGSVGTGKTFMAACIANALIDECIPCVVTNFSRIINKLSGTWEGKQEDLDIRKSYSLLVLDEFATDGNREYVNEIVYNVIDSRYRSGKPLIITTNLSTDDFKHPDNVSKQRIYSRINEMCVPIPVTGKDRRSEPDNGDYIKMLMK